MANTLQNVVDEIAEIIRRVGKREEIEDQIAQDVDFSELVAEQLKVEGPVRDMAIKAITVYLKSYEIDAESDEATEIVEAIDFKQFIPTILKSDDFQEVLSDAVQGLIDNGDLNIADALTDAIDAKDLKEALGSEENQKTIADKIKSYIEDFDMSNLGDDTVDALDNAIFSKERIEECLQSNVEDVNEAILKKVNEFLDTDDEYDNENPVVQAITESKVFKNAVDAALEDLVKSGRVDKLVEKVAVDLLSGDDSVVRESLTNTISSQLVNRIAKSIVDQAFRG